MGDATILDELEAILDNLVVTAGGHTVTFPFVQWEEQEEARGEFVTAELEDAFLTVSDMGGGAQSSEEVIRVRYWWTNAARTTDYAAWKNELIKQTLAAIRGNEKGFTGGYFVEVTDIEFNRFPLEPSGQRRGAANYVSQADFLVTARRHDVYA